MNKTEILINQIAQSKIDFEIGYQTILNEESDDFQTLFSQLRNYIFNSIPNKTGYNSETFQKAINSIPLKQTFTSILILKTFPTKIAFSKLEKLPKREQHITLISLLWIFKEVDTHSRITECKNGCGHKWHNIE